MLEFRLLGPLEVVLDGTAVRLAGRNQRALLALLLLHCGEVVSSDRLVDALWGETPPPTALTSLQNTISQLRKAIGADVLETRAPGYRLVAAPAQVDGARFEQGLRDARALPAAERAAALRRLVAMWRGAALADVAGESFAQAEIRRLEELRVAAIEDCLDAEAEAPSRGAGLVAELESLVVAHPLRERLRGMLMVGLYRAGRQADALAVYQDTRRTLVDELGIEPGADLQRLYGAILRHEVPRAAAASIGPAGLEEHAAAIAAAMLAGRVVPVLGLVAGGELAGRLAAVFGFPADGAELPRVTQYVATMLGAGPLYDALHDALATDDEPDAEHLLLAALPALLRARGQPNPLVVTTRFDLALERAFAAAREPVDVLAYVATGRDRGRFSHQSPGSAPRMIDAPNAYAGISFDERSVVLRLGGRLGDDDRLFESFLVTEDDHIEYLAQRDLTALVPATVVARLRRSHLLFLGFPLADWSGRLVLSRMWGDRALPYRSWVVQPAPSPLEREFWRQRGVDVIAAPIEDLVTALAQRLRGEA